jgi:hypothetical protein
MTPQLITEMLLLFFKTNLERTQEFSEAFAKARTEEEKREVCEQFKNSAINLPACIR